MIITQHCTDMSKGPQMHTHMLKKRGNVMSLEERKTCCIYQHQQWWTVGRLFLVTCIIVCLIKKTGKTNTDIILHFVRHSFTTRSGHSSGTLHWYLQMKMASFFPPPSASLEKWQLVPWEINTVALLGSLFHLYQGTAVDLAARVVAFNCDWLYWAGRGFCTCIILRVDLYLPNFNFNGQFFLHRATWFWQNFLSDGQQSSTRFT